MATMAYLVLLSAMLGAGLYAGVVVAPVTFNTHEWLGIEVLTQFQEGQIMTENFVRLSFLVNLVVIVVFLYESYKYKMGERDLTTQVASFVVIATGLMFGHYYLPDIVAMQMQGEAVTQSEIFQSIHKGSEINFKVYSVALLILIVQNMKRACK